MLHQHLVNVPTSTCSVTLFRNDLKLPFHEFDNGHREGGMAHGAESNIGGLLRVKVVGSEDAVGQGNSSILVEHAQASDVGDGCCVQQGLSMDVGEIGRNGNHALSDLGLAPLLSDVHELREKCRRDLLTGENPLFVFVGDGEPQISFRRGLQLRQCPELLALEPGVITLSSQDVLEIAASVSEIGLDLRHGLIAQQTLHICEPN
mmetsp:Transcript_23106/g.50905  ORF Transcript_23106/g.50905 Transcript_23106/m.50905 type:complete len:205 (+) Transcript_23106:2183-2797(+)